MKTTTTRLSELAAEHHDRRSTRIKPATTESEKSTIRKLTTWWGNKPPHLLKPADFDAFLYGADGLRHSNKSSFDGNWQPNAWNKQLDNLKPFIKRLILMGVVDAVLLDQLEEAVIRKAGVRAHQRLSHSQIQEAVEGTPDPYERWIVAFASLSMGRESELFITKLSMFNLETRKIAWSRPKVRDFDDGLPMFDQLVTEYERWREEYTRLCPDLTGDAFAIPSRVRVRRQEKWVYRPDRTPSDVGSIIKRNYARSLGVDVKSLPGQAAHMARRSGARAFFDQMRDVGIADPIRVVQAMLGHDKQATTELYIGLQADRDRRDELIIGGAAAKLMNWTDNNVIKLRVIGDG